MNPKLQVGVVGGGAAGFFAAITCAEAFPNARVTLLEASSEVLTKVRISGGGRCNVTHACFDPALLAQHYPRGGKALRGAFSRFQPGHTVDWFTQRQVDLKTEADGRMFPVTDDSATIADCLIHAARSMGVEIRTGAVVTGVNYEPELGFSLQLKSGKDWHCDRLLLATGSHPQGFKLAASLGHRLQPPVPSLFTFNIHDARLQGLAGVSVNPVRLQLQVPGHKPLEQTGPLLVTHWGISGPAVLKLSAWGARLLHDARYQATLGINWLPTLKFDALRQQLLAVKSQLPQKAIANNCPVLLPQRLWQRLCAQVGISPQQRWAELSNKTLDHLLQELTRGAYTIEGKGAFKEEFVTCGGVDLDQVNFKTMESRCCPELYFAGEILDIDGVTGGFNFQSAWTTGWLAGQSMGSASTPAPFDQSGS
jgi:predicted Rossmann fold flavoprotein